jgi:hypothetical protein
MVTGMDLVDLVSNVETAGFRGMDASMLPELRAIRRGGPGRARRGALLALLHLGGERALDPADLAVLRRLVTIKLPSDRPQSIDGCFNSWLTVRGGDQRGIMRILGLDRSAPATYGLGQTLVAHLCHLGPDRWRWRQVFLSPRLNDWTVVFGPSCDPDRQPQIEAWIEALSAEYGDAQAYFFGSQGEGHAWLVGSRGRILRRYSTEEPDRSKGEPLPVERRALQRLGLSGPPEQLDDDDQWEFASECGTPDVAAELSIDPVWTGRIAECTVDGHALVAWPDSDNEVSVLRGCYVFEI